MTLLYLFSIMKILLIIKSKNMPIIVPIILIILNHFVNFYISKLNTLEYNNKFKNRQSNILQYGFVKCIPQFLII